MKKNYWLAFGLLGFALVAKAQTTDTLGNAKIAIGISTNAYRGDLGQAYDKWTLAFQGSLLFNHQRRLHGGVHASYGTLTGQAQGARLFELEVNTANRFFKTTFFSMHYALEYDLLRRENIIVYLSQGLGFIRFSPENQFGESLQNDLSTRAPNETYGNVAAILPTQLGINYFFANRFGIGSKVGFANYLTDYIDNVSQLGSNSGNDNALHIQFLFLIPAAF
ncbi:hypothetical protein [Tunicatimonas pelagia]|uniref:hypothetical protein n=1 Tax=Tunicatimonas pelagia TaxID=931531 RepID=UPI00266670E3|nr:hypothetical protein [Tunicatimonas pelagia]WKN40604.1 hypothetical protein P0M28_16320 [Tunicatimonas pelagia]